MIPIILKSPEEASTSAAKSPSLPTDLKLPGKASAPAGEACCLRTVKQRRHLERVFCAPMCPLRWSPSESGSEGSMSLRRMFYFIPTGSGSIPSLSPLDRSWSSLRTYRRRTGMHCQCSRHPLPMQRYISVSLRRRSQQTVRAASGYR